MRFVRGIVLVVAACVFAAAADGAPRPGGGGGGGGGGGQSGGGGSLIASYDPGQIAQLFEAAGFKAQVITNNKKQMVQALLWPESSEIFSGAFPTPTLCNKQGQCGGMTLFVNLGKTGVSAEWLNSWNGASLFVRATTLKDGSLVFMWDVVLVPGVTPEYVANTMQLFKAAVDLSTDFKP